MTGTGSYTQDFDTLPSTGTTGTWADDTTLPGWLTYHTTGTSVAAGTFSSVTIGTGSVGNGALYDFGSASATDRALGSICSNSLVGSATSTNYITYGVVLNNTSTSDLKISSISYKGEQWRYSGTAAAQSLALKYFTIATAPTGLDGTAQGATEYNSDSLTFTSPITTNSPATTGLALDGNLAANSRTLSASTEISVPAGQYVVIKWVDINDSGNDHALAIDDVAISWEPLIVDPPPSVTNFYPANGATNIPQDAIPAAPMTLTFSEPIQLGTGTVTLKKTSDGSTVETLDINDFNHVAYDTNVLYITPSNPLSFGTQYYVEISAGAIQDLAATPNNFAGLSGPSGWTFTTAAAPTEPIVVINKYLNGTPDEIELLVVGTKVPGATVDLRGMIIKDFSASFGSDGGGSYTFTSNDLWSAVPVGTLITLKNWSATTDVTTNVATGDFALDVGLLDPTYFTFGGGVFDIAATEMVMIKAKDSPIAGTTGGIHALADGSPTSIYNSYTNAKLITPTTGNGTMVLNSTSTITDYMSGSDAQGGITFSTSAFGKSNNGTNEAFIRALRGVSLTDGDGAAYVVNATATSPYLGKTFFQKEQTAQSAKVVLSATIPSVTLTKVKITVPAALGTPGGVSLSAAGTATISGQDISITGASITTTSPLEITISGLITPTVGDVTDNGNYPLIVQTTNATGTLKNIVTNPAVRLIVPVSHIHDTDANGVALDLGTIVAVEGVCTEENFGSGADLAFIQAFIQDGTGGVNIFSPKTIMPTQSRGKHYVFCGSVLQYQGLTELVPATADDSISLDTVGEVLPEVVSITTLLASPEAYEGKLVTVKGLSKSSGTWSSGITAVDSATKTLAINIASGSTATTEPSSYPVDITGIFGQADTSYPYTANYNLSPRDANDLVASVTTGNFASWATTNGISGASADGDADGDGIANILEYALGLSPTTANSAPGTFTSGTLSFTKGTEALTNGDLTYVIETSTDLSTWTPVVTQAAGDTSTTISYTLPTGQSKIFARLKVTN
jgi:Bacterial Ig-like domain